MTDIEPCDIVLAHNCKRLRKLTFFALHTAFLSPGDAMPPKKTAVWVLIAFSFLSSLFTHAQGSRWTEEKAQSWYEQQSWLVGSNYIPTDAINELEMWQAQSFNAPQIDRELAWAESLGMNTMRVFLHDLVWKEDPDGFKKRINQFLEISSRHHIKPLFVLFDSCWDPNPKLGVQHPPIPGVHNSGWVQSPGRAALTDPEQEGRLKAYVMGVVGAFARDSRVLGWDVWNEPSNTNNGSYSKLEPPDKQQLVRGYAAQGVRVGTRGASLAASHQRCLGYRFRERIAVNEDAENSARRI